LETPQPILRISTLEINPLKRYQDYVSYVSFITNYGEPSCCQEAMTDTKIIEWKIAWEEEIDAFEKKKTWYLVELQNYRRVVRCKWV